MQDISEEKFMKRRLLRDKIRKTLENPIRMGEPTINQNSSTMASINKNSNSEKASKESSIFKDLP